MLIFEFWYSEKDKVLYNSCTLVLVALEFLTEDIFLSHSECDYIAPFLSVQVSKWRAPKELLIIVFSNGKLAITKNNRGKNKGQFAKIKYMIER